LPIIGGAGDRSASHFCRLLGLSPTGAEQPGSDTADFRKLPFKRINLLSSARYTRIKHLGADVVPNESIERHNARPINFPDKCRMWGKPKKLIRLPNHSAFV